MSRNVGDIHSHVPVPPACRQRSRFDGASHEIVKLRFEYAPRESVQRMHPGYFALVMATGIVALGARLPRRPAKPTVAASALHLWLLSLIFFRHTFIEMSPEDLAPPYWINVGTVAITTLTGTLLIERAVLSSSCRSPCVD